MVGLRERSWVYSATAAAAWSNDRRMLSGPATPVMSNMNVTRGERALPGRRRGVPLRLGRGRTDLGQRRRDCRADRARRALGARRRVAVAAGLAEGPARDAFLQGAAEAHRAPVLAAQRVADLGARHLAAFLQQVLDQRYLAVQPVLHLVGVVGRARGRRRPAGDARAAAPAARRVRAHRTPPRFVTSSPAWNGTAVVSPPVNGSRCSPGSSSSSPCADSGGAMSSRSRCAASTPIVAWITPPAIITIAPTR